MYRVLISLGSNMYSKQNIDRAKRMLSHSFPDVVFTPSIITLTNGNETPSFPFRNVLGLFHCDNPAGEIIRKLKTIESAMGRHPGDKLLGKVIIDIDLIQIDDYLLRPEDYESEYVQELLKHFN